MTSRDDDILHRIEREAGLPGLVEVLAERLAPCAHSSSRERDRSRTSGC